MDKRIKTEYLITNKLKEGVELENKYISQSVKKKKSTVKEID